MIIYAVSKIARPPGDELLMFSPFRISIPDGPSAISLLGPVESLKKEEENQAISG